MPRTMANEIAGTLAAYLSRRQFTVTCGNIYVLGSPWESDLVKINKTLYWSEFEIKLSVSDFKNDFKKTVSKYARGGMKKHDYYKGNEKVKWRGRYIPRPAYFWFVTPKGLIKKSQLPKHCGLLEYDGNWIQEVKKAPRLKKCAKLSTKQLYNVTSKLSAKICYA